MPTIDEPATTAAATTEQPYNGWPNYETYLAHHGLTNDDARDADARQIVLAAWEEATEGQPLDRETVMTGWQAAADTIERATRASLIPAAPEALGDGWAADLLDAALSRVNWYAVADALLPDLGSARSSAPADPADDDAESEGAGE